MSESGVGGMETDTIPSTLNHGSVKLYVHVHVHVYIQN